MTISVLPNREQTQLIGSQKSVRLRLNASVTLSSASSTPSSGPVRSRPTPASTPKRTTPGATALVRRSREVLPMNPSHEENVMPTPRT